MFTSILLVAALTSVVWGAPQPQLKSLEVGGRIVGGQDTTIEAHPYIVSILENNWHVCGGSIISANWILSAAHCFIFSASSYAIRTGSTIRNSGGQVISVSRIINHPNYHAPTIDFDISLLQLSSPITNSIARAIVLAAEGGAPQAGLTATITGWGHTRESGSDSTILQVVHVPVISQANCRAAYGAALITDRMFCAGLLGVGGRDACQNDSGGPLLVNGVLTGVVSWGLGCARADYPGVYASVPNLRAWIRNNSGV